MIRGFRGWQADLIYAHHLHRTVHVAARTLHYTSSPMSTASTVVIAPPDLLPRLVDRLRSQQPEGELIACADTDIPAAIDRVVAARSH